MPRLINIIPKKELDDKINQPLSELSVDFLGFENIYNIVASIIPSDKIIIDIGCYMGAQAYFFLKNPLYIGVDIYESLNPNSPKRFTTKNSIHVISDAVTWLKERKWEEVTGAINLNQIYVICSGVPNDLVRDMVYDIFPNCVISYPGTKVIAKGINSDKIEDLSNKKDKLY